MLVQLEINNIALIEYVCIEFKPGLNVLTGETGAGKSIIIDSINAVLGGRVSRESIRTGCESAQVSAVYNFSSEELNGIFDENGINKEDDDTIIISREFNLQGRNICRVNGKMVTLSVLKQIGALLVDIHGQNDNQSLLDVSKHIKLLDSFGGKELAGLKEEYTDKLLEYKNKRSELHKLLKNENERLGKLDLLKYQIEEIKRAKLKDGEEEELIDRKNILVSAEKIKLNLNNAYDRLYNGFEDGTSAHDLLSDSEKDILNLSRIGERYGTLAGKIQDINYQLYDVIEEIRAEKEKIEFEPGEIEEIEDRLFLLNELKRKYGKNISEILYFSKSAREEYNKLFNFEESTRHLEEDLVENKKQLKGLAGNISDIRKKSAKSLEDGILKHFNDLEMKHSKFEVSIQKSEEFLPDGRDIVEFLVSANLGEPLKHLAKIASGGEMSRIMLAIKAILANADDIPTLIFDEIDIGISGTAAARVGEKMAMISKNRQVLCVTHVAKIAAYADNNILIEKGVFGENTKTYVRNLSGDSLILEIARLLDGDNFSETSKRHAAEMLKNSK